MTRITYGLYRKGVREPGLTLSSTEGSDLPPTPLPTATAAIGRYHREGGRAALSAMERAYRQSSYWGEGPPQAVGWARAMVQCFERYISWADTDARPAFAIGVNRDAAFGNDAVGVHIDVVLLDPGGYVARLVFWDSGLFDHQIAVDYATPAFSALEDELGAGRVTGVEAWHLRSQTQTLVTAGECLANLGRVEAMVRRIAS